MSPRKPLLRALTVAAFALPPLVPGQALAGPRGPDEDGSWRLEGDVTGRAEYYKVTGDETQTPYRFTGWEPYAQLNLTFEKRVGPYRKLRAQFLGIVNDNNYRSDFEDVVVERATLAFEDGSARLPYRIEAGDTFAYFSQRTVQRPVKGIQFELQAPLGPAGWTQSLQFVSGLASVAWRDLDLQDDLTTGVSYLIEDRQRGRVAVNYVDNLRDPDELDLRREQRIFSVAAQAFLFDRWLSAEGEVAHLRQTDESGTSRVRRRDEGFYLQLRGARAGHPLFYRLRYEDYGEEFDPSGAPAIADRRAAEGHVGWRFARGIELAGRVLDSRDGREGPNPFDRTVVGVNLRGPLLDGMVSGLNTNIDFFVEDEETRDALLDARSSTLSVNLARTVAGVWTPRLRFFWRDRNDDTPVDADLTTTEVEVGTDRTVAFAGFAGSIGPGALFRRIRDGVDASNDYYPTLSLNLSRGPHFLRQDFGFSSFNRRTFGAIDVDTFDYNLLYRYTYRRHDFGVEFTSINRGPDPGEDTDSYRLALYWVYRFRSASAARPFYAPAPLPGVEGPVSVDELVPGTDMQAVRDRLARAGVGTPVAVANLFTYTTTLVPEISDPQYLVLLEQEGVLARAALVIESRETGREFLRSFDQALRVFIERYGSPTYVFEDGDAPDDVAAAVNRGAFIRIFEWSRPGGTLRFGVPRRLDGRLTLELQFARELPAVTDTRWSITDAPR
jgi:hypothetical protein